MSDNNTHSFGLAREWKIGKDLVILLRAERIDNFYAIFLSLLHYKSNILYEFYEGYLIGT